MSSLLFSQASPVRVVVDAIPLGVDTVPLVWRLSLILGGVAWLAILSRWKTGVGFGCPTRLEWKLSVETVLTIGILFAVVAMREDLELFGCRGRLPCYLASFAWACIFSVFNSCFAAYPSGPPCLLDPAWRFGKSSIWVES